MQLVDFILHVDRYLGAFVAQYGAWVYALLFLIVFVETGLIGRDWRDMSTAVWGGRFVLRGVEETMVRREPARRNCS